MAESSSRTDGSPDFVLWGNLSCWEPDYPVALMLGLDPRAVNPSYPDYCMCPQVALEYRKLRDHVLRAVGDGELKCRMRPVEFFRWARTQEIRIHPALHEVLVGLHSNDKLEGHDIHPRRKDSLLILISALFDKCGYDLTLPKSSAAREVAGHTMVMGRPLSEDTVLSIINDVKKILR